MFHVEQNDITDLGNELGLPLSRSQLDLLLGYERTLVGQGPDLGVISRSDRARVRQRHILDCMRAAVPSPESGRAYDLGSGGGLPGIVVGILRPGLSVTLVERRARRAAFLERAVRELGLSNIDVAATRLEDLPQGRADICFARALAALLATWQLSRPLLKARGSLVYFAGAGVAVPETLPECSQFRVCRCGVLEYGGPLVIITR